MPDPAFVLPLLWQSALLPFAAALAALVLARVVGLPGAAGVAAVAVGVLGSFAAAVGGQWSPLPRVALDWLPWIVLAGALLAAAIEAAARPVRGAARAVLALGACALVVWPAAGSLGPAQVLATALAAALLITIAWAVQARAAAGGPLQPLLLAIVAGGGGLALMLDSSQSVGRLGGALACALIACALLARRWAFTPAAAGLTVLVLGTLLLNAHVYAGFPLRYLTLLFAAVLAGPAVEALWGRRAAAMAPSARHGLAGAVLTALPVATAVGLAVQAMQDAGGY